MNFVHAELNNNSGSKNPLKLVTKSLLSTYELLFIDEFQVEDVADAMIVGDLLNKIVDRGMKVILTSNALDVNITFIPLSTILFNKSPTIIASATSST